MAFQCRFCLGDDDQDNMISPCLCTGSSKFVHRGCLDQWCMQHRNNSYYQCGACLYYYRRSRIWWASILSRKITVAGLSLMSMVVSGLLIGYGSSAGYNLAHYWYRSMPYHSPPWMQIIFHGMAWIAIPGLLMGLRDLIEYAPHLEPANVRQPSVVHHYHHYDRKKKEETKVEQEEEDEDKKKKTKVAPYEKKSTVLWLTLAVGVSYSFYHTYCWIQRKCTRLCLNAQEFIENV